MKAFLILIFLAILYSFRWGAFETMPVDWRDLVAILLFVAPPFSRAFNLALALLWSFLFSWQTSVDFPTPVWTQAVEARQGAANLTFGTGVDFGLERAGVLLLSLALVALFAKVLMRLRPRMPVLWLFPPWCVSLGVLLLNRSDSMQFVVGRDVFFYFTAALLPLCFLALGADRAANSLERLAFCFQQVAGFIQPKFVYLESLVQLRPNTEEARRCQIRAVKLLLWVRILVAAKDAVFWPVFRLWNWPNYFWIGFAEYNALHVPAWQSWCLIFLNTASNLVSLTKFCGITVGVFGLAGIYLPRSPYKIHRAKSLVEYYRRCLHYYSEIVVHLFFIPLLRWCRRFSNGRAAVGIALFFAIFLGGWTFHVLLIVKQFFLFPPAEVLANVLAWPAYLAAVALACCISASRVSERVIRKDLPWPFHFAANFFVHCLLNTMFTYGLYVSWDSRIEFYRSLLPGLGQ